MCPHEMVWFGLKILTTCSVSSITFSTSKTVSMFSRGGQTVPIPVRVSLGGKKGAIEWGWVKEGVIDCISVRGGAAAGTIHHTINIMGL